MNQKNIIYLLVTLLIFSISCKKESNEIVTDPFDHEAQLIIDRDSLYSYLSTHYFNTNDSLIWSIDNDEVGSLPPESRISLKDDPKLDSIDGISFTEIVADYTMYYYVFEEGVDTGNVGYSSPSPVDSVYVKYSGMLLDSTVFDSREDYPIWFLLSNTVVGWRRGMTKLKRGTFETAPDDDHIFHNSGKGYLIFPSGLGYANVEQSGIPPNSPLIFRIELNDVKLTDFDLDLVPTKFELSFDDGLNITADDFDGDGVEDYRDVDDDNDFSSTRDEVLDEFTTRDARGNIDFPYDEDGRIEGVNGGTPNYKNSNVHLED
ncbi:FKBP-type peptidyl-prolyl cis-trans isomerase [Flavicella marina]|uniref:FKBP-type peptidyl-prolyl cis-trans isomerase n=1 Tax=Flavicella marina TaxID=1475951 RepID=UPI001263F785|nr:FKBP-type peptidyl-prolyl cis-trans isomerase [Flavicella marina]